MRTSEPNVETPKQLESIHMRHQLEIDVRDLDPAELMKWRLIDIRDPQTAAREPITCLKSENLPLQTFTFGVPPSIRAHDRLLISCYHGNNSLMLTRWLREQGFTDVWSVRGGYEVLRGLRNSR